MQTIDTSNVPTEQFDQLEHAAAEISPEMLDVIRALSESVRAGRRSLRSSRLPRSHQARPPIASA